LFLNLIFASLRLKELFAKNKFSLYVKANWISTLTSMFIPTLAGSELTKRYLNFNLRIILYAMLSNLAMIMHIYTLMDYNLMKIYTPELFSIIALFNVLNTL
jgi:hypothetical protein